MLPWFPHLLWLEGKGAGELFFSDLLDLPRRRICLAKFMPPLIGIPASAPALCDVDQQLSGSLQLCHTSVVKHSPLILKLS